MTATQSVTMTSPEAAFTYCSGMPLASRLSMMSFMVEMPTDASPLPMALNIIEPEL